MQAIELYTFRQTYLKSENNVLLVEVKVAFAFSFLFVEGVEEQVRLHAVQQVEECCCIVEANNRFNIGDNKKEHSQEEAKEVNFEVDVEAVGHRQVQVQALVVEE